MHFVHNAAKTRKFLLYFLWVSFLDGLSTPRWTIHANHSWFKRTFVHFCFNVGAHPCIFPCFSVLSALKGIHIRLAQFARKVFPYCMDGCKRVVVKLVDRKLTNCWLVWNNWWWWGGGVRALRRQVHRHTAFLSVLWIWKATATWSCVYVCALNAPGSIHSTITTRAYYWTAGGGICTLMFPCVFTWEVSTKIFVWYSIEPGFFWSILSFDTRAGKRDPGLSIYDLCPRWAS